MVKIAVCGAAGRMGGRIIAAIKETEGVELSGALERPGHPMVGQDAGYNAGLGAIGVVISDDLNATVQGCDVLIDFTAPKVSLKNLEVCALYKKSIVIASQLPINKWHEYIAEPTLADAIMDRLMANAHRFDLKGESMRKKTIKNQPEK